MENYLDIKKNEILAAIYGKRFKDFSLLYNNILKKIEAADFFPEKDQKKINQIQHLVKVFLSKTTKNCYVGDVYAKIRKKNAEIVKKQLNNIEYVEYDTWKKRLELTENQFRVMLKTVTVFQITIGCSIFCRRCNEWALPGPRVHFSFDAVKRIMLELKEAGNPQYICYGASDPLDWMDKNKNIIDILKFALTHDCEPDYGILTKVPKGAEKIAENLLSMDFDIGVSITRKNRSRINRIEKKAGKKFQAHHDDEQLLIPAGFDEDFVSIKSSITDNYGTQITPEGAVMVIPALTSALEPTGQSRINITPDTDFFINKKAGREALLVEYFKPLKAFDTIGKEFSLDRLLDGQIENILIDSGSEEVSVPGMMNMVEYFKTFEPAAVLQRAKLFPYILKKLNTEILLNGKKIEPDISGRINLFRQKAFDYLNFCRPESVAKYKKYAFSFYLESIRNYLKRHSSEREIIIFLRKKDKAEYDKYIWIYDTNENRIDLLLEESGNNNFHIFQSLVFLLLDNPENKIIEKFIKKYPAKYDPSSDRFCSLNSVAIHGLKLEIEIELEKQAFSQGIKK